jgi:hypothetical protein
MLPINILNRLISASHLLESSGPPLTRAASSILLAQRILQAHDASELVLLALVGHLSLTPLEIDGKSRKEPSFMALTRAVLSACKSSDHDSGFERLFSDLNESRVAFKHHGRLPDPGTTYSLPSDVEVALNKICHTLLGSSLSDIDLAEAVADSDARAYFSSAKQLINRSEFKDALEQIALALADIFWNYPSTAYFEVGAPSTEYALLLSGRGIDPASFLLMQQLLPICRWPSDIEWETRTFGHPGNWTEDNAIFCLNTAVRVAICLQDSQQPVRPLDFYSLYEDVLTVIEPEAEAVLKRGSVWLPQSVKSEAIKLEIGDTIHFRATGHWIKSEAMFPKQEVNFEFAEWIAAARPEGAKIPKCDSTDDLMMLWIRKSHVEISFQEKPDVMEMDPANDEETTK